MPTFTFTSPEGKTYDVQGPEGATQEQAFSMLQRQLGGGAAGASDEAAARPKQDRWGQFMESVYRDAPGPVEKGKIAAGEAGLGMFTGAVAAPVAGLAGLASLVPGVSDKPAGQVVEDVERALTYQPRLKAGEKTEHALTYLPAKYSQGMEWAGGKVADVATALHAPPEVAGGAGALVRTAGEMLPAAFGLRGMRGSAAAADASAAAEATAAEAAAARAAAATKEATARAAAAVDRSAEVSAGKGQPGVRWGELPQHVQAKITEAARNAQTFDELPPEALQRAARFESLGIPYTRGQVTRELGQMGLEGDLAAGTEAGKQIADLRLHQTEKLHEHLERLAGGPKAPTPIEVGRAVTDKNLKLQAEASEKRVGESYDRARQAGETAAMVDPNPLLDLVNNAPNPLHLDYIGSKLKRLGMAKQDANGNWVSTGKPISLNDLEEIYKAASAEGKAGGTASHYSGLVKQQINSMTEGAGGDLYRAARADRLAHARTFENPWIMDRLLGERKGNRNTSLEHVWNRTVIEGDAADLQLAKRQILTGRDRPKTSRQDWRAIQSQTGQYLREMASDGPMDQKGARAISGFKLRKAANQIGEAKLNIIFGKRKTRQLFQFINTVEELTTSPSRAPGIGSDTASRMLRMLDTITKIPGVGTSLKVATGTAKTLSELAKKGGAGAQVREAMRSPLEPTKPFSMPFTLKEGAEALEKAARPGIARLSMPTPQTPSGGQ